MAKSRSPTAVWYRVTEIIGTSTRVVEDAGYQRRRNCGEVAA